MVLFECNEKVHRPSPTLLRILGQISYGVEQFLLGDLPVLLLLQPVNLSLEFDVVSNQRSHLDSELFL